jgi:hypothetical protein
MSTLDNRSLIKELDTHNYLSHILEIPEQLGDGFRLGQDATLPALYVQSRQVVIVASGEMTPVALALQALTIGVARVPVIVLEDYILPRWVASDTLVIALDYYGSNDQVITMYREAAARKARLFSVSVGGELAREARRFRAHHLQLRYGALSRVAFYYTMGAMVAVAKKLDLIDIKESMVTEAAVLCRTLLENINPEVAQYQNNAKQLAEKMLGRKTFIVGSGPLWSMARKWAVSITTTGKLPVMAVNLSDFNDTIINGLSGATKPTDSPLIVLLQSKYDHQRNKVQQTITYQVAQTQKLIYEQVFMHPSGSLFGEIILSALLSEMVGYYVALLQHRDPSETQATDFIRDELKRLEED